MSNRGGKRENAGRPRGQGKYGEPTVSIRIPQSQGATIKNFLDAYQRKRTGSDSEATNVDEFFIPIHQRSTNLVTAFFHQSCGRLSQSGG
jgi:DNA polymerase V